MDRENELKKIIANANEELDQLKGKKIRLCGGCYHKATPKHSCYSVKRNGRTDIYRYARGVTFEKDGRANIDWDLQ